MGSSSGGSNRARMGAVNMAMQDRSTNMEVGLILPAMKLLFLRDLEILQGFYKQNYSSNSLLFSLYKCYWFWGKKFNISKLSC